MLPSRVVLELTPQQFAYLRRAVQRDVEETEAALPGEEDDELRAARRMHRYLGTVEQVQVYSR